MTESSEHAWEIAVAVLLELFSLTEGKYTNFKCGHTRLCVPFNSIYIFHAQTKPESLVVKNAAFEETVITNIAVCSGMYFSNNNNNYY